MGAVVVLVDHRDPRWRGSAAPLLALAHELGGRQGWSVDAVWVGPGHDEEVATWVASTGPVVQHVVQVDGADPQLPASLGCALRAVADDAAARLVLVPSTFEGREVAGQLAALTGSGVVVGASSVVVEDGLVVAGKAVLAGSWRTRCAVTSPLAVVALDVHAAAAASPATPPGTGEAEVRRHRVQAPAAASAVQVLVRAARPVTERPSLAEAEVVVVGGRGTGGDFSGVEDLADALGGAVGATRVATDEGWAPHALQVGQTGVTISPRLYVGAGVSGAVHHRGGMAASATVVAVSTDPDAPIFEVADVAVVADVRTLLPALAAEVRSRRHRSG